jgi:glycosyltransferase involved in cell wall biosynthesis
MKRARIAVVVSGFPRRSETFAINELLALEERGVLARIFATKPGEDGPTQPGIECLLPRTDMLAPATPQAQSAALAERLRGSGVSGLHAYFAHTPAEIAMTAADLLGLPFGFSVHARDVRKADPVALAHRAARATCVIACNVDAAADVDRVGGRAHLVPHGVDLARFHVLPPPAGGPFRVLAIGRLVEKKGFDVLIGAVARCRHATLRIVGDGPLRQSLDDRIRALGAGDRITLAGPRTHAELPAEYAASHAVAVPSVVDANGDRDGLPNVVLEAMASGRAVIGAEVGAITSAVRQGETGLLVPPRNVEALAAAIDALATRPRWHVELGARGRRVAEREYDVRQCAARFAQLVESAYA